MEIERLRSGPDDRGCYSPTITTSTALLGALQMRRLTRARSKKSATSSARGPSALQVTSPTFREPRSGELVNFGYERVPHFGGGTPSDPFDALRNSVTRHCAFAVTGTGHTYNKLAEPAFLAAI